MPGAASDMPPSNDSPEAWASKWRTDEPGGPAASSRSRRPSSTAFSTASAVTSLVTEAHRKERSASPRNARTPSGPTTAAAAWSAPQDSMLARTSSRSLVTGRDAIRRRVIRHRFDAERAYTPGMQFFGFRTPSMPTADDALPGRSEPIVEPGIHTVLGTPIAGPWPEGTETAIFGLGCFWGAEKAFWELPGVVSTAVGYAGGYTPNPTYREACTGRTGHAEVVLVAYDPKRISYEQLLKTFWEDHDPTQAMRQGNDVGTQYRSIIIATTPEQLRLAEM